MVVDNEVDVVVPPLHHQVVTATLRTGESARDLQAAQAELEAALRGLDERYEPTPAGLGVTVAWGLPYFRRYVAGQAGTHLPVDTRASAKSGKTVRALVNAVRFPSDPPETLLEENDVAVLLRSDSLDAIADGANALFEELDGMFRVTSIRKGFAGGGFDGSQSLPKRMAMAAGVPGADLIPDTSELFLGFTSTQKAGLGPPKIANFETLGYVDLGRSKYFALGTHMHLSHLFEDLERWYLNFDHRERVDTTFRPGLDVPVGHAHGPAGPGRRADAGAGRGRLRVDPADRPQRVDPVFLEARRGRGRARRHAVRQGHGNPPARRLQHARQPVLLDGAPSARPLRPRAGRGPALRRLQPVE